jgi:hypothetical protein
LRVSPESVNGERGELKRLIGWSGRIGSALLLGILLKELLTRLFRQDVVGAAESGYVCLILRMLALETLAFRTKDADGVDEALSLRLVAWVSDWVVHCVFLLKV